MNLRLFYDNMIHITSISKENFWKIQRNVSTAEIILNRLSLKKQRWWENFLWGKSRKNPPTGLFATLCPRRRHKFTFDATRHIYWMKEWANLGPLPACFSDPPSEPFACEKFVGKLAPLRKNSLRFPTRFHPARCFPSC